MNTAAWWLAGYRWWCPVPTCCLYRIDPHGPMVVSVTIFCSLAKKWVFVIVFVCKLTLPILVEVAWVNSMFRGFESWLGPRWSGPTSCGRCGWSCPWHRSFLVTPCNVFLIPLTFPWSPHHGKTWVTVVIGSWRRTLCQMRTTPVWRAVNSWNPYSISWH